MLCKSYEIFWHWVFCVCPSARIYWILTYVDNLVYLLPYVTNAISLFVCRVSINSRMSVKYNLDCELRKRRRMWVLENELYESRENCACPTSDVCWLREYVQTRHKLESLNFAAATCVLHGLLHVQKKKTGI